MIAVRTFRKYRYLLCLPALLAFGRVTMAYKPPPPRIPVARLREQLKSPDVSKRLEAVRELGSAMHHMDIRPAAEALGTVFDDPAPKVRLEALRRLDSVLWRRPVTEKELSAGRADGDSKAEWLLKRVLSAAQDKDDVRRAAALRALGCFHVSRATAVLQKALSDKKPAIRAGAIRGMQRAGSKQFVGSLLKALDDPDHQVQKAAINAMFRVSYAGPQYNKARQPAVKPLMRILESKEHPLLWSEAARALGRLRHEQAVPMLIKALEDPKLAQAAASALCPIRTQTALDALLAGLKSKHDAVRRACTGALPYTNPKYERQVIGPLMAALKDTDAEVVYYAAYAMGERRVTEAVPSLIELLKHRQPQVLRVAARALGRIGDKRATAPLKLLLKDPSESVRDAAGEALWLLGVRNVGWKPRPPVPAAKPPTS